MASLRRPFTRSLTRPAFICRQGLRITARRRRSKTSRILLEPNNPPSRFTWTVGAFWQLTRELSLEEIHDPMIDNLLEALYGDNALDIFGEALLPNGDSYYNINTSH